MNTLYLSFSLKYTYDFHKLISHTHTHTHTHTRTHTHTHARAYIQELAWYQSVEVVHNGNTSSGGSSWYHLHYTIRTGRMFDRLYIFEAGKSLYVFPNILTVLHRSRHCTCCIMVPHGNGIRTFFPSFLLVAIRLRRFKTHIALG